MIVVLLFCIACTAYWILKRLNKNPDDPPLFPYALPIVGHALGLIGTSRQLWATLNYVADKSYDIGGVVSCLMGPRTVYIVTDPDDLFTVANTCLAKDDYYDFGKPWLGEGLVTAKLPIWKVHRKLLNPAFNQIVLDSFMGVFNAQGRKFVKNLQKEVGKGPFDQWEYTRQFALETIFLTALGLDFTDSSLDKQYKEASELLLKTFVARFTKIWLHSPRTFKHSSLKKEQDEYIGELSLNRVYRPKRVLQRRKSEFNGNICAERSIIPGTKFKAFMDLLLELSVQKGVLNDREIREHVDTMIVGGHDTSANVLMYTLWLLGAYPDVQQKVYDEIKEVTGGTDRDIEKRDLSQLVYLEAVIKESLRIFTIGPVVARKVDKDIKLKNCTLKAGHTCFLFLFAVHKHPVWGPDRKEFKPERWLNPSQVPENAFVAFGIGRRMCIGKNFGYMSMKVALAHVVRQYRITAEYKKLKLKLDVLLKPEFGHYISIENRS